MQPQCPLPLLCLILMTANISLHMPTPAVDHLTTSWIQTTVSPMLLSSRFNTLAAVFFCVRFVWIGFHMSTFHMLHVRKAHVQFSSQVTYTVSRMHYTLKSPYSRPRSPEATLQQPPCGSSARIELELTFPYRERVTECDKPERPKGTHDQRGAGSSALTRSARPTLSARSPFETDKENVRKLFASKTGYQSGRRGRAEQDPARPRRLREPHTPGPG